MNDSSDDAERLAAVQRYQILDTPPDEALDRITAIAARLFVVPIALVTVVDRDRIWFKSRHGLAIEQIDREPGLCASAILQSEVYAIADALQDSRTLTNSLVRGEFGLRFYAAAPFTTHDGYNLGTLCIIDRQPRQLTAAEAQTLVDLAVVVMDELELRLSARQLVSTTAAQRVAIDNLYHGAPCGYHSLDEHGVIIAINDTELGWLGYSREAVVGQLRFSDVITPASQATFAVRFPRFKQQGRVDDLEFELVRADGTTQWISISAIAEYDEQGNYVSSRSTAHNISDRKRTEIALRQLNQSLETKVAERNAERTDRIAKLEASDQALHLSNQRFRNAFDYAGIGMALVSLEGHWLEVNRALCEITGYGEAELLATTFQAITHPDDLDTDLDLVRQLLNQEIRHYHLEKRYRHQQGHWIWVMLTGSMVTDERQVPLYFVAQIQDINERKQTALQLENLSQRLELAVRSAQMGIWDWDINQNIILWDERMYELYGLTKQADSPVVYEIWANGVHPDDRVPTEQLLQQSVLGQASYDTEFRVIHPDHSIHTMQAHGIVICDAQGNPKNMIGVNFEITDRVQGEHDLREMSTALAHAIEGISRLDNAGHYVSVNQAYATMVGYTPEELVGQNWQITVHPDDLERVALAYEQMLAEGKVNVEARAVRKDGSIFHKQLFMVAAYDDQQQRHGHYCFMKDISERAQLEAERRQAEMAKATLMQDLQDSEERYRSVVAALSEGVAVVQADCTLLTCNASAAKIVGLQSGQIVGRSIADLSLTFIQDDGSPCPYDDHPVWITLRTGQSANNRVLGLVKPHGTTWISCNTRPLYHPDAPLPYAVVVSFTDITKLRRSEMAALRRRAEQERLLSEIAQRIRQTLDLEVVLTTTVTEVQQFLGTDRVIIYRFEADGSGTVIAEAVTPGLPSLLGQKIQTTVDESRLASYQRGEVRACADIQTEETILCPMDRLTQAQAKVIVPIVQGNSLWGMLLAYHGQSPHPWEASELDVLKRLATQLAIAIQQSQLYQHIQTANRQLEHLATHDGLTQLANRRSFDTHLQQEWSRLLRTQAPLSLILCDIDYFKPYNDTYGHPAGDVCLQQVAQTLEQVAQRPADLVARYGGEEFAIVLPNTDFAGAEAIARAIQQALAELALYHGASPLGQRITLSLGIASVIPTADQKAQTLIDQADAALYSAKQQGRDRYCLASADS